MMIDERGDFMSCIMAEVKSLRIWFICSFCSMWRRCSVMPMTTATLVRMVDRMSSQLSSKNVSSSSCGGIVPCS